MDHHALAAFLLARVAQDEAVVLVVGASAWDSRQLGRHDQGSVLASGGVVAQTSGPHGVYAAIHIGRWDPARVLTECETKRAIIDRCVFYLDNHRTDDCSGEWLAADVLVMLGQAYAWHHDYRNEWAPDAF